MNLVIINETSRMADKDLESLVAPLQRQVTEHFEPAWGAAGSTITFAPRGTTVAAADGVVPVHIRDRCGISGDLGFHEDPTTPDAIIGALDCQDYGMSLSQVISHEVIETLADPLASMTHVGTDGLRYMLEPCDPVQDQGYMIDGVMVSDFVLPSYFDLALKGGPLFNHLGTLMSRCPGLLYGGYIEGWNGTQWVQRRARRTDGTHSPMSRASRRSAYRARSAPE